MDSFTLIRQLRLQASDIKDQLWMQNFLTAHWWLIAITIAASYIIWWKFVDKRRVIEILLFGSYIAVCRLIFDNWGISSGRWTYTFDLLPIGYSLFLNDLTVVPLFLMLVYQYSLDWKTFLVWLLIVQGIFSFALLPLLTYLGILKIYNWTYYGSFIFMLVTAIVMRAIMIFGLSLQKESRVNHPVPSPSTLVSQPAMKPMETNDDGKEGH
ncbi:CBO0543 family protein [Pelosinus sp. UFO1]|uniref:CBO0543 family protein n=1 Tax=Pelosinus sp. UFO1 TaxID=484770 RepID=UPI0004D1D2ED|nr:CBO0543 family protein [Pelosinus sp. UFO1]AIF54126.1 hypothetical protein UFO1_4591 [Pelosinus sp. UFO1]